MCLRTYVVDSEPRSRTRQRSTVAFSTVTGDNAVRASRDHTRQTLHDLGLGGKVSLE